MTDRAAHELKNIRKELADKPPGYRLTQEEALKLRDTMIDLRKTLTAEAVGNVAYIVTDKRIDVRKLLNGVGSLLGTGVFDKLSTIAQYDLVEAGKCIAFERPTAGAFHLLRGTEDVLRQFYCTIVQRGRVKPLMWGPMVDSLRKRRGGPATVLLDQLDNIRRSFRNPTQHPEKIYDIQEVQDLFGLCVDSINRMSSVVKPKSVMAPEVATLP